MIGKYFGGLDVSTQSCKLVLINVEKSQIIYQDQINYDRDLPKYHTNNGVRIAAQPQISESDPHMWIEAINLLFQRVNEHDPQIIPHIRAISVSGQQHGLVTLTKDGRLSRPYSKLWNDVSTEVESQILTRKVGGKARMMDLISNTQRPGYTAGKIFHMVRHEPENYQNTHTILLVHNYINWYLTGSENSGICVMEPGDVSGSGLWNPKTKQWAEPVIKAIDPQLREKLPPVQPSRELIGKIGEHLVKKYRFNPVCQIASGSGDNMMGAIGTGNIKEGIVTISLGTSGTAYTFQRRPFLDEYGEIASFCDATGHYLPLLCISNMANGYDHILDQFNLSHDKFEEIITQTPPGNNGKVLIPWYIGERTPDLPQACPIYFGFALEDFTPEVLCRAVLEGHVCNLYEGFTRMPLRPQEIRLTGGMAQSQVWQETIANIFDCDVIPIKNEGAALGAAIHAAWSVLKSKTIGELTANFVKINEALRIKPDQKQKEIYKEFFAVYHSLSQSLQQQGETNPFTTRQKFLRSF